MEPGIADDESEELPQSAFEADLGLDHFHLALNPRQLLEANVVDLVGSEVSGGRDLHAIGVIDIALGQTPHTVVGAGAFRRGFECGDYLLKAATERAAKGGLSIGQEPLSDRTFHGEFFHLALEVGPDCRRVNASCRSYPAGE